MSELPSTWMRAPIGALCELLNGRAFKPSDWSERGLPIVRIQNLNNPGAPLNHYDGEVRERFLIDNGELLFAWSGTPGTSFGAHIWMDGPAILNQHIFKIEFPEHHIDKRFFRYAINQKLQELIDKAHGGVGLRHVTKGKFEETEIELPPLAEQRRIVAKLDSLCARSARARRELDHVPKLINRYKQAILGSVFSELVDRGPVRPLEELVDPERGIPYGIVQTGSPADGGVPTVRCGDIKEYQIAIADLKRVAPQIEEQYHRTRLRGGEVLLSIRGTIGNPAVASNALAGCNISREVAMIPVLPEVDPYFVCFFLSSPYAQEFIGAHTKGVAQSGINLRDLRRLPTPALSPELQAETLKKVLTALAWLDKIVAEHQRAAHLLPTLDQAIIAKAFRGELVPQDPNDEPASVLLERIKADREATNQPRRRRT